MNAEPTIPNFLNMVQQRRIWIMTISIRDMLLCIQGAQQLVWDDDMPSDAYVHNVSFDTARNCFTLMLVSADFEPVPEGEQLPVINHINEFTVRRPT